MGRRPGTGSLVIALATLLVTSCSYSSEEPGLLGRPSTQPPSASTSWDPPAPPVPEPSPSDRATGLPLAAEAEWTSADGKAVTVRIAVHAVRRVSRGTVLDWSVTPLAAPGLSSAAVPPFDLALLSAGRPAIVLLEPATGSVFRPVRLPAGRCLCSAFGPTADGWRIGATRLLQVTFPSLPSSLSRIDVAIGTIPVVSGVPVTPEGRLPPPRADVDLSRAASPPPPYLAGPGFDYPTGQRLTVQPYLVLATPSATTLVWRVQALGPGPGLVDASAPPLAGDDPRISGNRVAASGPVLVAGGERLTARLSTDGAAGRGQVACLCSDLRSGTGGLRSADQIATLVTTYDPLPAGVREVRVEFPGYGDRRIDVTPAPVARATPAAVDRRQRTWTSPLGESPVWTARDWPTPVPDPRLVGQASPRVDRLLQ